MNTQKAKYEVGQKVRYNRTGETGFIESVRIKDNPVYMIGAGGMGPADHVEYMVCFQSHKSDVMETHLASGFTVYDEIDLEALKAFQGSVEAERQGRIQAQREREEARQESLKRGDALFSELVPSWAKAYFYCELVKNDSDSMSDYYGHTTSKPFLLGFSKHTRNLFPEFRKMALNHPETAFLADGPEKFEHRENYSMGGGYYLKDGWRHSDGWVVKKQELTSQYGRQSLLELLGTGQYWEGLKEPQKDPSAAYKGPSSSFYSIEPHYHTKKQRQMWVCVPGERMSKEEFGNELGRAREAGGWYSKAWGGTPGGFAFWDSKKANAFAGGNSPDRPEGKAKESGAFGPDPEKMVALAERMESEVERMREPSTQNPTPKRNRERAAKMIEADTIERAAKLLRKLSTLSDSARASYRSYCTKKGAIEVMRTRWDTSGGYYSIRDTGKYCDDSETARILQGMVEGKSEDEKRKLEIEALERDLILTRIPGFFQTPGYIVEKMVSFAAIREGDTVLEPSAGSGAIADRIKGFSPQCVECNHTLAKLLELKGHKVENGSFLDHVGEYDRILMNPPFENFQDIEHVQQAFDDHLKEGGRLVAILGNGYTFSNRKIAVEFREWLSDKLEHQEELPSGTFKGAGLVTQTGVTAQLIVLTK